MTKGWYLVVLMFVPLLLFTPPRVEAKQQVGWIENVRIHPGDILVRAKLDTGAQTSSLNCECQQTFSRDGEQWVRFTLTNHKGESVQVERKIHRVARIKQHGGGVQERLVVILGICLGDIQKQVEVNLVDRSGFNYQLLIGRSFLKDDFIIDPSSTYTVAPHCAPTSGK